MTNRVAVVGLGLMGGSLLRRLALATAEGAGGPAVGWDADPQTRAAATQAGFTVAASLEEVATDSDVMFLAVPLPELSDVFTRVGAIADHALVVSDLTSVKQPVRDLAAAYDFAFVGGHPMAGTERSGFAASDAQLLAGASWVLTLDEETEIADWLAVAGVLTALGLRVVPCTSADHDRAVARISHLPHVLAAAVTSAAADDPLALALAAGSFRDATRVAATRPELTAAMCGGNSVALRAELDALAGRLRDAQDVLGEPAALTAWFAGASRVRAAWPSAPDVNTELLVDQHLPERLLAAGRAGGHVSAMTTDRIVITVPF